MTSPGAARYVLVTGEHDAVRLALPVFGRIAIGSDQSNDVRVQAAGAASRHLVIHADRFGLRAEALGAALEIVRGERVVERFGTGVQDLQEGDRLLAGDFEIRIVRATELATGPRVWSPEDLERHVEQALGATGGGELAAACVEIASRDPDKSEDDLLRAAPEAWIGRAGDNRFQIVLPAGAPRSIGEVLAGVAGCTRAGIARSGEAPASEILALAARRLVSRESALPAAVRIIGSGMEDVDRLATRIAAASTPVLILGETGVGKDLIARAIHERSSRARGPFVKVSCADLFSRPGGDPKSGPLADVAGGTLVLDEITGLTNDAQLRLVHLLERIESAPEPDRPDLRVLATTNHDVRFDVETRSFRKDLLFRIARVRIRIPPLRDRPEDVIELAEHFIGELTEGVRPAPRLAEDAIRSLRAYSWPGNVRELRGAIESALLLQLGETLEAAALPREVASSADPIPAGRPSGGTLKDEIAALERARIIEALAAHGTQAAAAKALGMSMGTFLSRMDALGIPRARKK